MTVYEGRGLEGIDFGYVAADVERILGAAEGGSEHHLSYASSGVQFCFCGGTLKDLHFRKGFRGKLYTSGLGIGSTLDAVVSSYGEVQAEKEVDDLCGWMLDRTLLVRRGEATADDETVYKLYYYDAGLFFLFDEQQIVREFGVFKKTDFLARFEAANPRGRR